MSPGRVRQSGRYKPGARKGKNGITDLKLVIARLQGAVESSQAEAAKKMEVVEAENLRLKNHAASLEEQLGWQAELASQCAKATNKLAAVVALNQRLLDHNASLAQQVGCLQSDAVSQREEATQKLAATEARNQTLLDCNQSLQEQVGLLSGEVKRLKKVFQLPASFR